MELLDYILILSGLIILRSNSPLIISFSSCRSGHELLTLGMKMGGFDFSFSPCVVVFIFGYLLKLFESAVRRYWFVQLVIVSFWIFMSDYLVRAIPTSLPFLHFPLAIFIIPCVLNGMLCELLAGTFLALMCTNCSSFAICWIILFYAENAILF